MAKNTVYRVEFENTAKREKERRKAIADAEREAARPRIASASRFRQAAMTGADEALRLSTGFGRKGWLAVPKEKWDKLDQLEKESLAKIAQNAMETGVAYAVPGMMTYGSTAARLGNRPLMETMLARKPWAEMTRGEKLALKQATRYEMGAQGMGVETLDDVRYVAGAKIPKRRYSGQYRIPDRGGTPLLDAFKVPDDLRSDPELLSMLRSTRVSLDDMGAAVYGQTRKSHVDLNTRLFNDLTGLRDSTVAHEFDHVLHLDKSPAAPVASLSTSKMPGVYGERAAAIDKDVHGWVNADYVFSPREVDARTTGARTALSPAERTATLREDIALRDPLTAEYIDYAKKKKLEWENSPVAKSFRQKMKAVGFDENTRGLENPLDLWLLGNEDLSTELRYLDPKARPIVQDLLQERLLQQDAKGGDTSRNVRAAEGAGDTARTSGTAVPGTPVPEAPARPSGPRIVVNPQVFTDKRDALCVAMNEALRLVMEANGFEPVSEPTEAQRKFFSDTAYADDELQLRRTILARIATLDTSVKDPTDEQLEETAEMLEMVMEVGAPQNEWEQSAVQRLHDMVVRMRESPRSPAPGKESPEETGSAQAAEGAGVTMTGSELDFLRRRYESGASMTARQRALVEAANAQGVERGGSGFVEFSLDPAGENAQAVQPAQLARPVQLAVRPAQANHPPQANQPPQPETTKTLADLGWNVSATGGNLVRTDRRTGVPYSAAQEAYNMLGVRMPSKAELEWLRRRADSGASLSAAQRRVLDLTAGMAT